MLPFDHFVSASSNTLMSKLWKIRQATDEDVPRILDWLKSSGSGFLGNSKLIVEGQARNNLVVAVQTSDEQLVGFLLSTDTTMDIMEIKEAFRGQGIGRMLATHGLNRIEQAGRIGVLIQCCPKTSIQFWEKIGFQHVDKPNGMDHGYFSAYIFPNTAQVPAGANLMQVRITITIQPP